MRGRHLISVLIIMALFGSAYPVGKLGVDHFPPFAFAALRSLVLTLALLPLWRLALPAPAQRWPLAGFCISMGFGVYATMYAALGLADTVAPIVIGTQLSVPFAVMLGRVVLGERVRWLTWTAIAAAFGGILVIALQPSLAGDIPALMTIGASALCYATATLFARSLRSLSPITMNGWMAAAAVPLLAALSLATESGQWVAVAAAGSLEWAVLLHSALVVSLLGHVWMFSLYRHYPVASVIPYYVLMPVFGIAISLLVFAEIPAPRTLIGGAIVIAATWVVSRSTLGTPAGYHATRPPVEAAEPPPPEAVTEPDAVAD